MSVRNVHPIGRIRSVPQSLLLVFATGGVYSLVWTYRTHKEISEHNGIGVGGGLGLFIFLVSCGVGTLFLVPYDINQMLKRAGATSRVNGTTGFWILVPIAGLLVWYAKVQSQLNDYWASMS